MKDLSTDETRELRFYLGVVRRRAWAIVGVCILTAAAAAGVSLLQENTYEASTEVLIQRQASDQVFTNGTVSFDAARNVQTEIKVLRSRTVSEAARTALGYTPIVSISGDDSSDVVTVTASSASPPKAAREADAYAQAYVVYRRKATVDSLLAAGQEVLTRINDIDRQLAPLSDTSQERAALESQRAYLVEQLGRLQVSANLADAGGAVILAKAGVPGAPVSPKPARDGALGAALGLLLGIGLAFLFDYLDDSIKERSDLERAVGGALPVVGEIPMVAAWKKKTGPYLVSAADPDSAAAEAYRTLRTSVQFLGIDKEIRSFQITSARAQEGKTTTLANLAVSLARAGRKVVVVCGDLRRPRVHEFFGLSNQLGLTSVLLGEVKISEAVQWIPTEPRLAVLASGPPPPNPSELLASPRVREIIETLGRGADILLFDSPPVLPVSDAMVIAGLVDATLLVACANLSSRRAVHRACELLRQVDAPLVGLVLNNAESETSRYGYGGYRYEHNAEPLDRRSRRQQRRQERESQPEEPPSPSPASMGQG